MSVYVCPDKDIVCGDRPENWCLGCPQRGLLQVAVAPHAAAHNGPTQMRPATPEEHRWLTSAARRVGKLVPHPGNLVSAGWRAVMRSKETGRVCYSSRVVRERKDAEVILKQWPQWDDSDALTLDVEELFAAPPPVNPPAGADGGGKG